MLISNSSRFIFIHIMKCAGSSVEGSLRPSLSWNDIQLGGDADGEAFSGVYYRRHGLWKHSSAAAVRDVVGTTTWNSYTTFATVRCPYERVTSTWGYIASCIEPIVAEIGFPLDADPLTRMRWLDSPECPDRWMLRWPLGRAYLRLLGRPDALSAFLRCDEFKNAPTVKSQRELLTDPLNGRLLVQRTVRTSELADRWPELIARLGLTDVPLLNLNETPTPYRMPPSALLKHPGDVQLLNEMYHDDFREFGFKPLSLPT